MAKSIGEAYFNGRVNCFKCGIEIELEQYPDYEPYFYWKVEEDGSLRNGGRELISDPLEWKDVDKVLMEISSDIIKADANARCGIHVHMSIEDFDLDDIKKLMCLYFIYEPLIFLVSGERKDNSFCVGYEDSIMQENLHYFVNNMQSFDDLYSFTRNHGKKYFALNIIPIHTQGTVEFRHHKASNDIVEIKSFITLIKNLHDLVLINYGDVPVQELVNIICATNTISNYEVLARDLLQNAGYEIHPESPVIRALLRSSVFNFRVAFNKLKV